MMLSGHHDLLWMLVTRNLKIRYKGSTLGFLWSLLTPLSMIAIYAVFAGVLGLKRQLLGSGNGSFAYLPFLVTGIITWQFTAGTLGDALHAIVGNANLVKKVYFPRSILPLSTALANAVNFLLTFVILLAYLVLCAALRPAGMLWLFPALALHILLAFGISLFVSTVNVFFRDAEHIVGLLQLAWFFMTPVMYETSLQSTALNRFVWYPANLHGLIFLNPMTGILALYRHALMGMDLVPAGISPLWILLSLAVSLVLLVLGFIVLRRGDRSFGDAL